MRIRTVLIGGAAATAIALTGFGLSNANAAPPALTPVVTQSTPAAPESTTGPDTDTTQSGDQTTPDTTPEKAGAAEAPGSEAPGSETASDGPGGHADGPGNVDNQFEGVQ